MQQESKFNNFSEKDIGLELLMNPRKKQGSDVVSLSGKSSISDGKSSSIKSINVRPSVIDVGQNINIDSGSGSGSSEYETETDISYESEEQQPKQQWNPRKSKQYSESEADTSVIEDGYKNRDRLSEEEILLMKKELLYQFERFERKGMKLPKKFTLASSLDEMKMEFERLKKDRALDSSVKLQRRILMATVSGVEWLNGKFDPIGAKLDGWSDSIYEDIDNYDEIFEELHEKYKSKASMSPEMKLVMMLGGSAFMHHMTHSFKNQMPGLDEILKQNPDLAKNLAAATSQHINNQQNSAGNLFGSLFSGISGMFGGAAGGGPNMQRPNNVNITPVTEEPQKQHSTMKGPSNIDELLREFQGTDRVEMVSVVTESEIDDLAMDDTSSINGILLSGKKNKNGKKTLEL